MQTEKLRTRHLRSQANKHNQTNQQLGTHLMHFDPQFSGSLLKRKRKKINIYMN